MQIGRSQLSPEEREYCFQARECLYCGKLGHRIASCPVSPKDPAALNNQVFAAPVKLIAPSNHNEAISFFTFPSPDTLLILEFPWLQKHSPHTDWARKKMQFILSCKLSTSAVLRAQRRSGSSHPLSLRRTVLVPPKRE